MFGLVVGFMCSVLVLGQEAFLLETEEVNGLSALAGEDQIIIWRLF